MYYQRDGTKIRCMVPPGVGKGYAVELTARGVYGNSGGFTFGYDVPNVTAVTPPQIPTTGAAVVVAGSNFGAAMSDTEAAALSLNQWLVATGRSVTVNGLPCEVADWSQGAITCTAPEGIDNNPVIVGA